MVICGLVTIMTIAWTSVAIGSRILLERETEALEAVRTSRANFIENYFRIIRGQVVNFARDDMIVEAIAGFIDAFSAVSDEVGRSVEPGSPDARLVEAYYETEFRSRAEAAGLIWEGAASYLPTEDASVLLQAMYIGGNPNPVGQKDRLDEAAAPCAYNRLHAHYHPLLRAFRESFGYYDIFLFDLEGNLVYSVFKETDFATNFLSGPYRETNLAAVYRRALDADAPGSAFIADFKKYAPSYGAAASFIASPVFRDGVKIGVAVFQMPVDEINAIMMDKAGLGTSGESYLVGPDHLMRSDSRFSADSTIFRQMVTTIAAGKAIAGESGTIEQRNYLDDQVLSSFGPVNIEGLDWAILSEIGMAEVVAPTRTLRNQIILVGVVIGMVAGVLSAFLQKRIVIAPVGRLAEGAERVQQGDYATRVDVDSSDELGELAHAFNTMTESIARDIEERKRTAAELLRARQSAESANRVKSQFLSNMSHELRTPLNGVLGYVQILLRDSKVSSSQRENLEAIESCGRHLLTLINDVLDLSKIEAGRLETRSEPCDLHKLLKSVQDIVTQQAESKGITFSLDVSSEVPRGILTDSIKLRQVLINLLGNSIKFTKEGGVGLRVHETKDHLLAFVAHDTGIGMSSDELAVVFDAFKQAEAGIATGGAGLGLPISRRIIEAMGGSIHVESVVGEGTTFTILHPLEEVEDELVSTLSDGELTEVRDWRLVEGQDVSILIVDDRAANRDILSQLLRGAGFRTVEVEDGAKALDVLAEQQFPLVLMDVRMAGMGGIEATQRIRQDTRLKDTVVIAVTASVFPEFREQLIEDGFDDFIGKPFHASEVFTKIGRSLDLRFVESESPPQSKDESAEQAEALSGEAAGVVANRLEEAIRLKNLSALNALAAELSAESTAANPIGERIANLARSFDFKGLTRLAQELGASRERQS